MRTSLASVTHKGNLRPDNQDRIFAGAKTSGSAPEAILAVADGMGGLSFGDRASELTVQLLARWWERIPPREGLSGSLDAVIYEAHRQIFDLAESMGTPSGSTLSLLYLRGNSVLIKQIGDSRVYRIRQGGCFQLTRDQTWANRMIDDGRLTPRQADAHRMRNALVNALGVSPELEIVTVEDRCREGDAYLVCSDGFYHDAPLEILAARSMDTPPEELLQWALGQVLTGRAPDNASAAMICLK